MHWNNGSLDSLRGVFQYRLGGVQVITGGNYGKEQADNAGQRDQRFQVRTGPNVCSGVAARKKSKHRPQRKRGPGHI